ncbi:MAG: adenylate cyclase [Polyangiales bacterium]|jgi:adenylate cyclase
MASESPESETTTKRVGPRPPSFSLRRKLALLTAAITLIPIPLAGAVLVHKARTALEDAAESFQLALIGDMAGSLRNQLTRAEDAIDSVGRLLMNPDLPEEHAIRASMQTIEGIAGLDHVAIYDAEGVLIDVVRESGADIPESEAQLSNEVRTAAYHDGAAIGAPTAADYGARLLVVVPLRDANEEPRGYAASHVSLAEVQAHVSQLAEARFESPSRRLYVIDHEFHVVAESGEGLEGEIRVLEHPLVADIQHAEFRASFAQQRVYTVDGVEYLGTLSSVPRYGWGIVVQVPTEIAFAAVTTMQQVVFALALILTLLALFVGLALARSITKPIDALVQLAGRIGRRELGATVDIHTTDELRTLGDALSGASIELKESEEAIRNEHAIRSDLGRYLPAEIVERVVHRKQDMALGGSRREITVLFADVVNFTPMTEQYSPEVVVAVLNEMFTFLTEIVFRHGGTVDKFIGDCVMAMWNAPADQPDHAERALNAAEEMILWLETGNEAWLKRYGVRIQLAIGVHTGEAIVGNVGSETRMQFTAIGDVVNVAARLEAIARPQQILVTQATADAAGDSFEYGDLGERELVGRTGTVQLLEVRT